MKFERFFGRFRTLSQDDKSMWRFTPFLMWHADDGDFLYCWVAQEATFHLDRRDVLAAADNDILKTVADFNKTVRVNDCSVSAVKCGGYWGDSSKY